MTALNVPCSGCRAPVDITLIDTVIFRQGPANSEADYYHQTCWQTGWYTGIPFKGDPWPEEVGYGAGEACGCRHLKIAGCDHDPAPTADPVNAPAHYRWLPNGIEVIDITESFGFLLGNVLKYVMRADHKGKPIEDLEKAAWYLAREIANRKNSGVV